RDAEQRADLPVRVALDVVEDEGDPVDLRESRDRPLEPLPEIRLDDGRRCGPVPRLLQLDLVVPLAPELAEPVQRDRDRDRVQPRRERGLAAETPEPLERSRSEARRE